MRAWQARHRVKWEGVCVRDEDGGGVVREEDGEGGGVKNVWGYSQ